MKRVRMYEGGFKEVPESALEYVESELENEKRQLHCHQSELNEMQANVESSTARVKFLKELQQLLQKKDA